MILAKSVSFNTPYISTGPQSVKRASSSMPGMTTASVTQPSTTAPMTVSPPARAMENCTLL